MKREGIRTEPLCTADHHSATFKTFDAGQRGNDSPNAALVKRFGLVVLFEVVQPQLCYLKFSEAPLRNSSGPRSRDGAFCNARTEKWQY